MNEKKERSLSERQVVFLCALVLKLGGKASITLEEFKALDKVGPGARIHFSVTNDETMTAEIVKGEPPTPKAVDHDPVRDYDGGTRP